MKYQKTIVVLVALCLCITLACKQQTSGKENASTQKQPPVDINKPVENPTLVDALNKVGKDQGDISRKILFNELKKAVYLIPVLTDNLSTTSPDTSGRAMVTKDSQIKFLVSNDKEGNPYLPIFTDWQEIGKYTNKKVNTLVMPANTLWAFVLKQDNFKGAILNPGDKALPLDRAMIQSLQKD